MKIVISVRVSGDGHSERRQTPWEPSSDGPWSKELRNLNATFEVGEIAKGMTADILGGLAEVAFSSPASRIHRSEPRAAAPQTGDADIDDAPSGAYGEPVRFIDDGG